MNLTSSKVAIILATYNGAAYIEEQARSILAQTYQAWHVFVRDDGSRDKTLEILGSVLPSERLTIIDSRKGRGGSPALNFFSILKEIDLADFGYVAFCDQDDIWAPGKLSRAVSCLLDASAGGYSSNLIPFDYAKQKAWWLGKSQAEKDFDYLFQGASAGCTYTLTKQAAVLVQTKIDQLLAAPPPQFSHDWAIYAICRSFGFSWYQDAQAHIFYRQHASNSFGALPSLAGLYARFKLARSGWYRAHVIWLAQLLSGKTDEKIVVEKVSRFGLGDRIWLALNAAKFRRRRRDVFLFALVLLCGAF